jgi:hypothetical protein
VAGETVVADLKLPKLPDRTPVKFTIAVSPDLAARLASYADAYEAVYSRRESVGDLIPFMLAAFLEGDRAFNKRRKDARLPRTIAVISGKG